MPTPTGRVLLAQDNKSRRGHTDYESTHPYLMPIELSSDRFALSVSFAVLSLICSPSVWAGSLPSETLKPITSVPHAAIDASAAQLLPPHGGLWGEDVVWTLNTTPYTRHFHDNDSHNNQQHTVDIERWHGDNILGVAYLRNSFNQPIGYAYMGQTWHLSRGAVSPYMKLTEGIVVGYKGVYKDKVPFNFHGLAPAILPSFGIAGSRFIGEVMLFGMAGAMINVGVVLN